MPIRSARERFYQTLAFEAGGLVIAAPLYGLIFGQGGQESVLLLASLSLAMMIWAPLHNTLFDMADFRLTGRSASDRPKGLRVIQALSMETGSLVVTLPLIMALSGFGIARALMAELGLTLFQDEDISGFEYPAGGGRRIDILAKDAAGNFVVLELKVEKGYDRVVGQLLRYMNWVRKELAEPGQRVRGIIVCRTMSEDLILACSSIKDVELLEYRLQVTVTKVPSLDLGM